MADRDILPNNFKPVHYDLVITDLEFETWSYSGKVTIEGELTKPTKDIVINTLELDVTTAKMTVSNNKSSLTWPTDQFTTDTKSQRTTLTFPDELPLSAKATLTIQFKGKLNHDMAGFYRSQYRPAVPAAASVPRDSEWHYMLSTQFEAGDARRAFPCFDEPNLKATFDFAIEIPDDQVALSNMPVKDTQPSSAGRKVVSFERTPIMSTYLLAWAVGDFEYVEAFTEKRYNGKQLPVRVYTTRGLAEQGRWALEHAPKVMDYFSEEFDIEYPLPKSDILAVHEFTHGAMENWGLVTYRMSAILFDEKVSEAYYRARIAYVVAHELAHQWFGNLVTMDWWDELWLNEGFATWAGWYAIDHFHPDWEVWPALVNGDMEEAFALDSIRASHPIQVPVRNVLDTNQVFDAISYRKGCCMIRMIANHLGVKTFLKGISIYLRKHAYGNAKTQALWTALGEASGEDVNALMGSWIEKIGHPVVRVEEPTPGWISLTQSRFLKSGDVKPEDDTTTWWLPLSLRSQAKGTTIETVALTTKGPKKFAIAAHDGDQDFYVVNSGAPGFYRVQYPTERLDKLSSQLEYLTTEDKIFIVGSAAALAYSGDATTAALLTFVKGMSNETHYLVLSQALDALGNIKSIFGDDDLIRQSASRVGLKLIAKALNEVGWNPVQGEDHNISLLRKRLLLTAVTSNDEAALQEAISRFTDRFLADEQKPIHADIRAPVYRAAIRNNPAQAVEIIKNEWYTTTAIGGKEVCLRTLGHVTDPALITGTLLPFLFNMSPTPASDFVPAGDMHMLAAALAANRIARPLMWDYMREHWDLVMAKLGSNLIVLDRLMRVSLQKFNTLEAVAEIEEFFKGVDTEGFDRTLETVKDSIRARAAYRARDAEGLRGWFVENGFAS